MGNLIVHSTRNIREIRVHTICEGHKKVIHFTINLEKVPSTRLGMKEKDRKSVHIIYVDCVMKETSPAGSSLKEISGEAFYIPLSKCFSI